MMIIIGCHDFPVRNIETAPHLLVIVPRPERAPDESQSAFLLHDHDAIYFNSEFSGEAAYFVEELAPWIELRTADTAQSAYLQLLYDASVTHPEGYHLQVNHDGITIRAASPKGAFYALQTLLQLQYPLREGSRKIAFSHATVHDQPRFEHRGMLLDCCRHFMEPDFILRYIDLLARYKMNVLHWHLTEDQGWRFESDAYPLLTEVGAWRKHPDGGHYGGFYTKDDMRNVVAYAAQRHVKVIPEIELPGHSTAAIASYPWLSCTGEPIPVETEWGVFKDIYCAGNDSTLRFLETIFDEVLDIFPSDFIHIGGDEAPKARWEKCPKCQKRIRDEQLNDEHELQGWFVNHFRNYLNARQRTLIGWDEILEGGLPLLRSATSGAPAGWAIQSWRGTEGGEVAARAGVQAVMSPTSHAYFDYDVRAIDLEKVYTFEPVPEGLTELEARYIIGGECNMWTEHAPQHSVDRKVFPRILAMAEVLWTSADRRDIVQFKNRVTHEYPRLDSLGVEYGPEAIGFKVHPQPEPSRTSIFVEPQTDFEEVTWRVGDGPSAPLADDLRITLSQDQDGEHMILLTGRRGDYEDSLSVLLSQHAAIGLSPIVKHPWSSYYTGGGSSALTDGIVGSDDFRDGHWQAFSGYDLDVTLQFRSEIAVSELVLPFYTYSNAWIFMPERVIVEGSTDGIAWRVLGTAENPLEERDKRQGVVTINIPINNENVRHLRIRAVNRRVCPDWHDAPGEKAWLFASELIVRHSPMN